MSPRGSLRLVEGDGAKAPWRRPGWPTLAEREELRRPSSAAPSVTGRTLVDKLLTGVYNSSVQAGRLCLWVETDRTKGGHLEI